MTDAAPPPDDLPADLVAALARLQAERPGSWLDVVADAVTDLAGTDGADLLAMAADRAASGQGREPEGDPEQALANLEADLRAAEADMGDHVVPPGTAIDLLAELPPARPPRDGGGDHRDMGN